MRPPRRARDDAPASSFCDRRAVLFASAATANAECAWVLWSEGGLAAASLVGADVAALVPSDEVIDAVTRAELTEGAQILRASSRQALATWYTRAVHHAARGAVREC